MIHTEPSALIAPGRGAAVGMRSAQGSGDIRPPGLHVLCRSCVEQAPQDVVLFTSIPLTDEAWRPLDDGEVVVAHGGTVV